ncbi:hypothetical protein B0G77_4541 [Paraburkholderia sp. BL10I2N1]|nr:hypothetical protein B0G77_4541 [Paraburkholderia sp. BL10I2N1]
MISSARVGLPASASGAETRCTPMAFAVELPRTVDPIEFFSQIYPIMRCGSHRVRASFPM